MRWSALLLSMFVAAGCAGTEPQCRVGADCASGACLADGRCVSELPPDDPGEPDPIEPTTPPFSPAPAAALACQPNLDGSLEADEMRAAIGVPLSFLVSPAGARRGVDVAGAAQTDGSRRWDWSAPAQDDVAVAFAAQPLAGKWYAGFFPGAQFALPLDASGRLVALYSRDSDALRLHGLASVDSDPAEGRTLLVYETPIAAFRFPLRPGATWTSEATVRVGSQVSGLPYSSTDTYEVRVDALGRLDLPDVSFAQVHRVRTRVTMDPSPGSVLTRRQVSFVAECFGEVARATSLDNESREDFTTAAEIRRVGLQE